MCKRCISKGLECGGYPDNFRFCGIASRGKWKDRDAPVDSISAQSQASKSVSSAPNRALPPSQSLTPNDRPEIEQVLDSADAAFLLSHYDRVICPHQIAQPVDSSENPYRLYVLPLAYEQIGLLYAVLALSACHLGHLKDENYLYEAVAVDYRLKAITELSVAIRKVCSGDFSGDDRDGLFATIQILLLHDICESGISSHGAHISGAMSISSQLMLDQRLSISDERTVFFLGNLAWLDIIRAFSAPGRLYFSQKLREKLLSLCNLRFESVNGCPRELVLLIGEVLEHAKAHSTGNLEIEEYSDNLRSLINKFYTWDSSRCFYPDENPLWLCVTEAYRHTCILRTRRLLDENESAVEPCIQESVTAILDSIASIPGSSPLIELLVLPLFMAGADCLSPHSRHYILLRLGEIKARSEMGIAAPQTLLEKVWHARTQKPADDRSNVPWMLFTHSAESTHQDDYLII
ncbi:fungal-specific transcription factor domain-containing protein [Penicillium longicatenatum]|uniref:fungal-specific transcription factor domain-containing protein n=1 Tax=Penicillium longicatenatum TaxID=1561947 RepID=UPI00254840E5|nr:fungal-specific transcription factor domain-containing protein [Penicillium longicatenatum]KAJ5658286.1 fungal-specific transcription factor domain-containing protein [Penicillium longicatenatum]